MSGLATYQFDIKIFKPVGDGGVEMNRMAVFAYHIQRKLVDGITYVDYFEIAGLRHYYALALAEDSVEIEVYDYESEADKADPTKLDIEQRTLRSTMKPRNQSDLLEAIDTISSDFEDRLDVFPDS